MHHFSQQLTSPFPPMAAVGTKTTRIKIGTTVIGIHYRAYPSWSKTR
ncbi:hypothetical protein [Acidomonas methanolica]